MRALGWGAWLIGVAAVVIGLGWQVAYANDRAACMADDRLVLCSGPMADWLMPVTVVIGLSLAVTAAWRLIGRP